MSVELSACDFVAQRAVPQEAFDLVGAEAALPRARLPRMRRKMRYDDHVLQLTKSAIIRERFLIEDIERGEDASRLQFG